MIFGLAPKSSGQLGGVEASAMAYIVTRNNRFYVVSYDGIDPTTGKERRRWQLAGTSRAAGARHRERVEADYQAELRDTVVRWLDFAPEHDDLAARIADGAAAQATVVGSGRVGRTKTLSVDERAALAARAYIRHHHTGYHDRLDNANFGPGDNIDDGDYREIKRAAHDEVEAFLDAHRRHHSGGGATI